MKISFKNVLKSTGKEYEVTLELKDDGAFIYSCDGPDFKPFSNRHHNIDFAIANFMSLATFLDNLYWDKVLMHARYLKLVQSGGSLELVKGE